MLIQVVVKVIGVIDLSNKLLCVIVDYICFCVFLIVDGVMLFNENCGYVLCCIICCVVCYGNMFGVKEIFFYKLVGLLIDVMGFVGEDLKCQQVQVEQVLKIEEEQFVCILECGLVLLDEELVKFFGDMLDGEIVFCLYDIYGFLVDLMVDVCCECNIKVDEVGFEVVMEEQCCCVCEVSGFVVDYNVMICVDSVFEFKGYDYLELNGKVIVLFVDGIVVDVINVGQEVVVVLD